MILTSNNPKFYEPINPKHINMRRLLADNRQTLKEDDVVDKKAGVAVIGSIRQRLVGNVRQISGCRIRADE